MPATTVWCGNPSIKTNERVAGLASKGSQTIGFGSVDAKDPMSFIFLSHMEFICDNAWTSSALTVGARAAARLVYRLL